MRTIKFRGKFEGNWWYSTPDNNNWEQFWELVGKDTVGQYIGRNDRKNVEIYEDDIVRINHPHDMTGDFTNAIGEVFWWDEEAAWYHGNNNDRPPKRMWPYVEVIGNSHDNEDLLEEEEEQ